MAAEDELGRVGVACNGSDGVGVGTETVVVQVWGEALRCLVSLHDCTGQVCVDITVFP
jgi:hypothetical protein